MISLTLAYDATIEGWSRAMDLRDRETEGHSQRVAEMTLQLARLVGLPDQSLVHLRRGALLHDIGKMGIPDEILQKVGPLTDAGVGGHEAPPGHGVRNAFAHPLPGARAWKFRIVIMRNGMGPATRAVCRGIESRWPPAYLQLWTSTMP